MPGIDTVTHLDTSPEISPEDLLKGKDVPVVLLQSTPSEAVLAAMAVVSGASHRPSAGGSKRSDLS
jgi:hypothetical protein